VVLQDKNKNALIELSEDVVDVKKDFSTVLVVIIPTSEAAINAQLDEG
jgi:hypothetical protein